MTAPDVVVTFDRASAEQLMVRAQANVELYSKLAEKSTGLEHTIRLESADFWQMVAHRCVVALRHDLGRVA